MRPSGRRDGRTARPIPAERTGTGGIRTRVREFTAVIRGMDREAGLLPRMDTEGENAMKTAAIAVALLLSGAAIAQTHTTEPDLDVDADVGVQPDGDLDVDADVDLDTGTKTNAYQTHVTASAADATGRLVMPSNANPERDVRGIAVISDPAVVPAGWNGVPEAAMGGPLLDPDTGEAVDAEDGSYPACTAEITDNCVQTYEAGVSG